MKNLFKQTGIFICKHDVHQRFSSQMSVYHVLKDKQCFPHGCIYFKWKCRELAKKKKCHRKFSHVGNKCFSCKYFYEEKIHQYPEILINDTEKDKFYSDYEEFNEWLEEVENKRVLCEGKVDSVRPNFVIKKNNNQRKINIHGFLITFSEGFINNILFEDTFYLKISTSLQNKLRICRDDEIEFYGELKIVKGRFEFFSAGKLNFYLRGNEKALNSSNALVALNSATIFEDQPQKCKQCVHSILSEIQGSKFGAKRALVCMEGIADYNYCIIFSPKNKQDSADVCANLHWNEITCKKPI